MPYRNAYGLQLDVVEARHQKRLQKDLVLFLEHPAVFTIGKRGGLSNLKLDEKELRHLGIEVLFIERGGDITYHGPGQLVGYLMVDMKAQEYDISSFVRSVEEVMIRTANDFGISAGRDSRNPGVWVKNQKLGSIGIAIRRGITFHGFALNVANDLSPFQWINPCGLEGISVTSLSAEKNQQLEMAAVKICLIDNIQSVFNVQLKTILPESLNRLIYK